MIGEMVTIATVYASSGDKKQRLPVDPERVEVVRRICERNGWTVEFEVVEVQR